MKKILNSILKTMLLFAGSIIIIALLYILFNLNLFHNAHKISASATTNYLKAVDQPGAEPYKFVADKFDDHSIVFLGELHKREQDLNFLNTLIPYLYKTKKINMVGWEFGASDYQKDADSIVTAPDFDRKKAISLMRKSNYYWCYEEYLNVFKTIWETNKTIPATYEKIRFLQLNKPYVPKKWNSHNRAIQIAERQLNSFDNNLPIIVEKEVLKPNKKILIYCGLHHSLTKFKTPIIFFKQDAGRAGQILYAKYPDKIFQICLLSPAMPKWTIYYEIINKEDYSWSFPFNGVFNQIYDTLQKPFAINTSNPLFADIKDNNSFYSFDTWSGVKLSEFCDGIIMHTAFDKINPVHFISDWVTTESELNEVKAILPDEDASNIKTIPDLIHYINPAVNINDIKTYHKIKPFWK